MEREIKQKTEIEVTLEMEDSLRDIQDELEQAGLSSEKRQELQVQEQEILTNIERRAKEKIREKEKIEQLDFEAMKTKLAKFFSKKTSLVEQLSDFKKNIANFLVMAGERISDDEKQKILEGIDACQEINEREPLIERLMIVIDPLIEFRLNNSREFELGQREAFANGAISGEKFIAIEGTDGIICYGQHNNRIHLHLAPMRTLTISEKLKFMKEGLPAAMRKLAEVIKNNPQIEIITATSYIVAANPDLFRKRIGFTKIGAMDKHDRLQHFGQDEAPVLRAAMTREEFLDRYGE